VLSAIAIGTITVGWRAIRRGEIDRHRAAMVLLFGLFASFLALYLYRLTVTGGPQDFPGPAAVEQFVYLPILAVHILLAIVCIPLVYYALLLARSPSGRGAAGNESRPYRSDRGDAVADLLLAQDRRRLVLLHVLY